MKGRITILTPDGKATIREGDGVEIEGKRLRRCMGIHFWYAHGRTIFDIRDLRRLLGFRKEEYRDDWLGGAGARMRIMRKVLAKLKQQRLCLTAAIDKIHVPWE